MKKMCLTSSLLFWCVVLAFSVLAAAQSAIPNAGLSALVQMEAAFSGGRSVDAIQLSGNANWYSGTFEDSGSATLLASSSGMSQMQLSLGSLGQRIETQSGVGQDTMCSWSGNDNVQHSTTSGACWNAALWFMPALTLQQASSAGTVGILDLGVGSVGSSDTSYRHLRTQLIPAVSPVPAETVQQSTVDLGLDKHSMLPSVLSYSTPPDNGAPITLSVEIRYSDYRTIDGVNIPFHIQRFVNGALQLEITISSAQIN
ncbi:MAG: hypothetical protein WBF42_06910 [Terracidiphilus sp.]